MIVKLYYEKKTEITEVEVSEEECTVMIQTDYEKRVRNADDGEVIMPRTIQEILDEEINKPTFNNNQTETRRHYSLNAMQDAGMDLSSEEYIELPDERYAELSAAIAQNDYGDAAPDVVADHYKIERASAYRRKCRAVDKLTVLLFGK